MTEPSDYATHAVPLVLDYRTTVTLVPSVTGMWRLALAMALIPIALRCWTVFMDINSLTSAAAWAAWAIQLSFAAAFVLIFGSLQLRRQWTLRPDGISVESRDGVQIRFVPWMKVARVEDGWIAGRVILNRLEKWFKLAEPLWGLTRPQVRSLVEAHERWRAASAAAIGEAT